MSAIQNKLNVLSILPMNKTVVFYSPIEGKSVLVRTGTISDGNSFYHSLLHGYSKEYIQMDRDKRQAFVKRLKSTLSSKMDKGRWETLSDGLIAKIPFQENVGNIIRDFYKFLSRSNKPGKTKAVRRVIRRCISEDKDKEMYKLFADTISLSMFEKELLPAAFDDCAEKKVSECQKIVVGKVQAYFKTILKKMKKEAGIRSKQINTYVSKMGDLMNAVIEEAEEQSYKEYLLNMSDSEVKVDEYTVKIISERFNRDVYFIDSRSRLPYKISDSFEYKKRKSMILIWTGGNQYEIVGRLLPGNRVQREFTHDDELIQTIYTYVEKPEKIPRRYPKLVAYLPKQVRNKIGADVSNSEEERMDNLAEGSKKENNSVSSDFEDSSSREESSEDDSEEDSDSD